MSPRLYLSSTIGVWVRDLEITNLFADGFESGNLEAWDGSLP